MDRVARLANGQFNAQANDPCASHGVVIFPGNLPQSAAGLCGQPIGSVATAVADLQTAFQAANAALTSSSPNPSFLGQALNSQQGLLAPNYQTPRSVQMNIGLQKQLWPSTLFSADYVRNVGTHYLIGYDTNHVGDATYLNTNAALNAINDTLGSNPLSAGCAPAASAGASSQTAVNCYLAAVPGASIADFANHGLDSGGQFLAGAPASLFGLTPNTGAAFPGINPLVGRNTMFFPAGRSLYSGLQLSLRTHITNPVRGVLGGSLQFSYTHSSFRSNVAGGLGDQDLLPLAADFNHPTAFFGSASQDRKNQFSARLDSGPALRHSAGPGRASGFAFASDSFSSRQWRSSGRDFPHRRDRRWIVRRAEPDRRQFLRRYSAGNQHWIVRTRRQAEQSEHHHPKLQHELRRPVDSCRPGPGQCRFAFAVATAAAGCGLADHCSSSAGKRRPGLAEDFRLEPGAALQDGRPVCCGAQRVGVQHSQLRQLRWPRQPSQRNTERHRGIDQRHVGHGSDQPTASAPVRACFRWAPRARSSSA